MQLIPATLSELKLHNFPDVAMDFWCKSIYRQSRELLPTEENGAHYLYIIFHAPRIKNYFRFSSVFCDYLYVYDKQTMIPLPYGTWAWLKTSFHFICTLHLSCLKRCNLHIPTLKKKWSLHIQPLDWHSRVYILARRTNQSFCMRKPLHVLSPLLSLC